MTRQNSEYTSLVKRSGEILGSLVMLDMIWRTFSLDECLSFSRLNHIEYPLPNLGEGPDYLFQIKTKLSFWVWWELFGQRTNDLAAICVVVLQMVRKGELLFSHDTTSARERCLTYPMNHEGAPDAGELSSSPTGSSASGSPSDRPSDGGEQEEGPS